MPATSGVMAGETVLALERTALLFFGFAAIVHLYVSESLSTSLEALPSSCT